MSGAGRLAGLGRIHDHSERRTRRVELRIDHYVRTTRRKPVRVDNAERLFVDQDPRPPEQLAGPSRAKGSPKTETGRRYWRPDRNTGKSARMAAIAAIRAYSGWLGSKQ